MEIIHQQNGHKGMFYVGTADEPLAAMTYTMPAENKLIIDHTEVSDALRGKNVGYQLVKAAVDFARIQGIKILPLCPFAKSVFDKKSEFADVLL
ncbi:GNAT family N-acetyltransferase [Limnovirga soli]|uniref:GNAT family N-acetyltransferase n=1 Tax=Limnovirga soli TaxID=2656915 RepID=A0A8J8JSY5_9BACT|nr:GNAT family N-acetyltransferase [Limnovirga soli]NNV54575.1 GNAT family N-acetyltransferase [Limnovirga soli]